MNQSERTIWLEEMRQESFAEEIREIKRQGEQRKKEQKIKAATNIALAHITINHWLMWLRR